MFAYIRRLWHEGHVSMSFLTFIILVYVVFYLNRFLMTWIGYSGRARSLAETTDRAWIYLVYIIVLFQVTHQHEHIFPDQKHADWGYVAMLGLGTLVGVLACNFKAFTNVDLSLKAPWVLALIGVLGTVIAVLFAYSVRMMWRNEHLEDSEYRYNWRQLLTLVAVLSLWLFTSWLSIEYDTHEGIGGGSRRMYGKRELHIHHWQIGFVGCLIVSMFWLHPRHSRWPSLALTGVAGFFLGMSIEGMSTWGDISTVDIVTSAGAQPTAATANKAAAWGAETYFPPFGL